jgi:hypothetical protein
LLEDYFQINLLKMAVKIEFLRKKMVKFVESMGINYSKKYYQRDLLQFIQ